MEKSTDLVGGGRLYMTGEGGRVRFLAEREADGRGLYKVWLTGGEKGRCLLGTLAPEGKLLRLNRTLSAGELQRAGCWPVSGGEAVLTYSFGEKPEWYCEDHPDRMVRDAVIAGELKKPALCRKNKDGFQLAVPFLKNQPIACESIASVGSVKTIGNQRYIVWKFDRNGEMKTKTEK